MTTSDAEQLENEVVNLGCELDILRTSVSTGQEACRKLMDENATKNNTKQSTAEEKLHKLEESYGGLAGAVEQYTEQCRRLCREVGTLKNASQMHGQIISDTLHVVDTLRELVSQHLTASVSQ